MRAKYLPRLRYFCQDCEKFAGLAKVIGWVIPGKGKKSQFGPKDCRIFASAKNDTNDSTMAKRAAALPTPSGEENINIINVEVLPHDMVVPRGSIEGFDEKKWKACGKF